MTELFVILFVIVAWMSVRIERRERERERRQAAEALARTIAANEKRRKLARA